MPRIPIPLALKRRLLPIWNEAHRLGWLARDYGSATALGRWETCAVCGRFRPMLYRRRVIPEKLVELWGLSPRLARALARKESSDCASCGAKLRARRMAEVLLAIYPTGDPAPFRSLADWVRTATARGLRIAEINRIEGLHDQLASLPGLGFSDYQPGASSGAMIDGVRSEDLTRLTYADNSFDLVLTSESLEHVPDLGKAIPEIYRILAPGGRHVCTVPILPGVAKTFSRTVLRPDGSLEDRAPRICHPGGDVGYPVFTELGADFPELVAAAGFEVDILFGPLSEDDLAQVYVWRKPGGGP
jgi:SAM-dependent methyltransferase